jgi:hypothetical protein
MTCVGFRVKTGWAAVVLLGGPREAPRLLDHRRLDLVDPDQPDARQPYHAGFGTMQQDRARIDRLVRGVRRFARRALDGLLAEYAAAGRAPRGAAIVAGSDVDPATIANLHMRAHALEGRLYRDVVAEAMSAVPMSPVLFVERELLATAAHRLGLAPDGVKAALGAMGKKDGRKLAGPWRAEEKSAALAAWLALPPSS